MSEVRGTGEPEFEMSDRGFTVRAWYGSGQNARIEVLRDGQPFREFVYPNYRIWNIAAHFGEMVDDFMESEEREARHE